MPPHSKPRQPLSCDNCRGRKIKCSGLPSPCHPCVRRGYTKSCKFQREAPMRLESSEYRNLETKIDSLATLLRQHIGSCPLPRGSPAVVQAAEAHVHIPLNAPTGYLHTSETGHVRFVQRVSTPDSPNLSVFLGGNPHSPALSHEFPFTQDATLSRQALVELLPPNRYCDELTSTFFNVFSPLFHVLHDPSFRIEYERFKVAPAHAPIAFLALLFVIISIATTALKYDDPMLEDLGREGSAIERIKSTALRYRSAAMRCLAADQFLWRHNLYTIKALVLLLYALNHTEGPAWSLLGATVNIAIEIGCHVDPSTLDVSPVEREERRRCWAGLMMLHQIQSTCLERPLSTIFHSNVQLPADANDDDIPYVADQAPNDASHARSGQPTQMSYLLYKFRLYGIAAALCNGKASAEQWSKSFISEMDKRIEREEDAHAQRFDNLVGLPSYHQAHRHILRNYTNHLYLLLHRHVRTLNAASNIESHFDGRAVMESRKRSRDAATAILDSFCTLCRERSFQPYEWYVRGLGSFHAFLACSTLLILLCTEDQPADDMIDSSLNSLRLVWSSIGYIEKQQEQSDICLKAGPILRQLSERTSTYLVVRGYRTNIIGTNNHQDGLVNGPCTDFNGTIVNGHNAELIGSNQTDWDGVSDFDTVISRIPTEQWLTPYMFPWNMN